MKRFYWIIAMSFLLMGLVVGCDDDGGIQDQPDRVTFVDLLPNGHYGIGSVTPGAQPILNLVDGSVWEEDNLSESVYHIGRGGVIGYNVVSVASETELWVTPKVTGITPDPFGYFVWRSQGEFAASTPDFTDLVETQANLVRASIVEKLGLTVEDEENVHLVSLGRYSDEYLVWAEYVDETIPNNQMSGMIVLYCQGDIQTEGILSGHFAVHTAGVWAADFGTDGMADMIIVPEMLESGARGNIVMRDNENKWYVVGTTATVTN